MLCRSTLGQLNWCKACRRVRLDIACDIPCPCLAEVVVGQILGKLRSAGPDMPADAITRVTTELCTAQRNEDWKLCQEILTSAMLAFDADRQALDATLFDIFGTVVQCASSAQCHSLVQLYLQLVSDHCSGREVLTLLMSALDNTSG